MTERAYPGGPPGPAYDLFMYRLFQKRRGKSYFYCYYKPPVRWKRIKPKVQRRRSRPSPAITKAGELLGLSPSQTRRLAHEGRIPGATKRGGHWVFDLRLIILTPMRPRGRPRKASENLGPEGTGHHRAAGVRAVEVETPSANQLNTEGKTTMVIYNHLE